MSGRHVSVVTCFLDAERFFEEAIESVFAQTHPDWELVLVDDGSRDGSAEIARRYERSHPDRVRCVSHPGGVNRGKSASRNAGVAASRGPLVLFLDADDVLLPHALRTLAGAISRSPEAAVAYGRTRLWHSWPGNPDGRDASWDFDSELPGPEGTLIPAGGLLATLAREDDVLPSICSAIVRRDALERVGGWEDAFADLYDDFVLWTKLSAEQPVLVIDETLSLYRKHADSSCEQAARNGDWSPVDLNVGRYRYLAWMERWLTRRRLGDAATWEAIETGLAPYRDPTAPVAIDAVAPAAGDGVLRGHLEHPAPGSRPRSHRVPIAGWVAGTRQRALGIELSVDGRAIRQVPLDARRPDVTAATGRGRTGELHGFGTSVAVAGTAPLALDVAAVLEDQTRVPLARVAARRAPRPEDRLTGGASVAAIVVCRTEAAALPGTIESLLAQTHRPLDVVVVDDGSSSALEQIVLGYPGVRFVGTGGTVSLAEARRVALRRCAGELVAFVAPGDRLHPRAIAAAVARLAARPESAFVAGSGADRPLDHATLVHGGPAAGPALYRRAALEVVGGLPDAPAGADDWALQLRLARRFPGIAIADPMLAARLHAVAPPTPEAALALLREEREHARDGRSAWALRTSARHAAAQRRRGLRRRLRRVPREGRALILLYHRVADLPADPWGLAVARERFAEQLAVLRAEAQPLSLDRLVKRAARGRLPRRAVAVTFDDGYRDNLDEALPELDGAGVPATLFLTAGFVGRREELWWDELERILLAPGELPAQLRVRAGAQTVVRDLGEDARLDEAAARRHARWQVGQRPPTRRHAAYGAVWSALAPLDDAARTAAIEELRAWAGAPAEARPTHRMLDPEGVATIARSGAMSLGAHTVGHPRLSTRTPAQQREEIARGKALVEELGGAPVRHFAYPFGGLRDYTQRTARLAAEAGFASACATWEGTATSATDPWQLPRVQVPDVSGEAFAELLAGWFES